MVTSYYWESVCRGLGQHLLKISSRFMLINALRGRHHGCRRCTGPKDGSDQHRGSREQVVYGNDRHKQGREAPLHLKMTSHRRSKGCEKDLELQGRLNYQQGSPWISCIEEISLLIGVYNTRCFLSKSLRLGAFCFGSSSGHLHSEGKGHQTRQKWNPSVCINNRIYWGSGKNWLLLIKSKVCKLHRK